ncbi:hypothetical protein [Enterococcus termitis]|nr:hypothetical protein [Enterococcus termitis]OJG96936.1 hypothetical protein RV18_GL001774 [Enterococcus termitis]
MVNHFSTVGIPVSSEEDFMTYANQVFASGKKIKAQNGTYLLLGMGEGIELWGQLNQEGEMIGLNPHFSGTAVSTVRLVEKVEDPTDTVLDGRIYSEADPEEDAFAYPFVFDVPDIGLQKIKYPVIREVQVAAFAHELSIYASEEDYHKSQASEPKFASEFFIPSGLFGSEEEATGPSSMAMFGGHVLTTKKIKNRFTEQYFYYAKVKTLGGEFDVVIDPELVTAEIKEGSILSGSFWLTGKLVKKRFKLFG